MISPTRRPERLHLRAAALALALAAVAGVVTLVRVHQIEERYFRAAAPESSNTKDLGIVWQKHIFAQDNLLPLYGSSELIKRAPNKASQFFASYPTGFAVSPVGRASCTSLILLEKIAASATSAQGRKIVISVSPSWFLAKGANHEGFEGNYSMMQASELFFSAPLSMRLKHRVAARMLRYPQVFEKSPILAAGVRGLAGDRWRDRALYFAALPLGRLQNVIYRLQDHYEVMENLRQDSRLRHLPGRKPVEIDWEKLLAESLPLVKPLQEEGDAEERLRHFSDDSAFLHALQQSYEWGDFELLLRTVRELGLDPLLFSMPIESAHFERMGISPQTIAAYAGRLREFARRYDVPVADFSDFSDDPRFFADHFGHPSAAGWVYFDEALDDFFHSRPLRQNEPVIPVQNRLPASTNNPRTGRPRLPLSGPSSAIPGT